MASISSRKLGLARDGLRKADDTSEQRLDKLEAVLAMGGSRVQAVAPLFAALLSIPFGERYPPLALSPLQQRRRMLAALLDQFEGLARRQPIPLSFEDAHWADATSRFSLAPPLRQQSRSENNKGATRTCRVTCGNQRTLVPSFAKRIIA